MSPQTPAAPLPIVVLISGEGSNLQAILDQARRDRLIEVRAVIASRADAHGLERARLAGIAAQAVPVLEHPDREQYDAALSECIDRYHPDLIVLAGFMRILTGGFVNRYRGRLINIHPSLLPKYPGLNTHRRVLEAGDREHGCSVHFVTEALDGGPVIAQARVPVLPGDTDTRLRARVQSAEHRLYPQVLNWFAAHRVKLENAQVFFDNAPLRQPRILAGNEDAIA
ncbi:MAG TPA: phosphoribosylglycinamide formyltransferase [Gammaproteobacteria bacterium]|nr:phosphoribosylglycinamide formyltransferase [Gammaproteobacteria bacterium]